MIVIMRMPAAAASVTDLPLRVRCRSANRVTETDSVGALT